MVEVVTDNMANKFVLETLSSKDAVIMKLVRRLVKLLLVHNIIRAKYIPTHVNIVPDALSRLQVNARWLGGYGVTTQVTVPSRWRPQNCGFLST